MWRTILSSFLLITSACAQTVLTNGTDANGAALTKGPLPQGGYDYTNNKVQALAVDPTTHALLMSQPQQPFLNTAMFTDVTAGSPTTANTIISATGTKWASSQRIDGISMCDTFANTAACQTDASTTGGMLIQPNAIVGTFTNSNNRPILNLANVDWRGFVHARDFGIKCDGSTDDTAAIQAAIYYACTGNSTVAPTGNACTNYFTTNKGAANKVVLPAGTCNISTPLVLFPYMTLQGAGWESTKIVKTTNNTGSFGSITAGTGVNRTSTACGGSACVDNYNVDAIIEVAYTTANNTGYAYEWSIRDLGLWGNATNGTKYGIFAPRAAQSDIRNVHINLNCTNGDPASCGSVQGSCYFFNDAWLMVHDKTTCEFAYVGWNYADDGSGGSTGTSGQFLNNYAQNIGCSGFKFNLGPAYSAMSTPAIDRYNQAARDMNNTDITCVPYSFKSTTGLVISGGGAEAAVGGIMQAQSSSVTVAGGFKTIGQTGYTSAGGTFATIFMDNSQIKFTGSQFGAVTSPGNILNMIVQNGSTLLGDNVIYPSGGSTFIGYGGSSLRIDMSNSGTVHTNASGNFTITPTALYGLGVTALDKRSQPRVMSDASIDGDVVAYDDEFHQNAAGAAAKTTGIGKLSWFTTAITGCTGTIPVASTYPNLGIIQIQPVNVSGDGCSLTLGDANGAVLGSLGSNTNWELIWIFKLGQTTNVTMKNGFGDVLTALTTTSHGMWVRDDTTVPDSAFKICVATGAAETCDATTYTADTNYHKIRFYSNVVGTWWAQFDANTARSFCASGCNTTVTVPTTAVFPIAQVITRTAAVNTENIDFFSFRARNLSTSGRGN